MPVYACAGVCICVSVYAVHSSNSCRWKLQMKLNSVWPEQAGRAAAAKCFWPGQDGSGLVMRHEVLWSLHKSTLSTCNSCSTHRHTCSYTRAYQRGGEVREGAPFACPSNRKCQSCMLLHQHYFLYLYPYSYPSISAHLLLHLCAMP